MRGPKASASLSARWPRVHDCQSSYKTNWGKGVDDCFTLLHVCLLYPCQNMCKIWPVRPPLQLLVKPMGGHSGFYRGAFASRPSIVSTNPHTRASEHTHFISKGLSNYFKWLQMNCNCKKSPLRAMRYRHCHSPAGFPMTSMAVWPHQPESSWVSHLHKDEPYFKHICTKKETITDVPLPKPICTPCFKACLLSLWCHCLCHESYWAEHAKV